MSVIFDKIDRGLVGRAFSIVEPAILRTLGSSITGKDRCNLHVVILNPSDGSILFQKSFGQPKEEWNSPYDEIALSKAAVCYKTGMTTRKIGNDYPWLYDPGDTHYPGGIIEARLAVAASGLQDCFDEMFAWMIFNAIQGLCRHQMYIIREVGVRTHFLN